MSVHCMLASPLNLWTNVGEKWLVIVSVSRHNLPCLPSPKVQRLPDNDDNDSDNDDDNDESDLRMRAPQSERLRRRQTLLRRWRDSLQGGQRETRGSFKYECQVNMFIVCPFI